MNVFSAVRPPDVGRCPDEELIDRIRGGETALYEVLMRRYNRRIYRAVLAILRNDSEAEDAMQESYVRAYQHLGEFAGEAKFSTWLTKIAIYEAMGRLRRSARNGSGKPGLDASEDMMNSIAGEERDPGGSGVMRRIGGGNSSAI